MAKSKQKFHRGDLVRVAKDLGPQMSHFIADCDAIVMGSYADQYGHCDNETDPGYTLFLKGHGEFCWYDEHQLTLIAHKQWDKLEEWEESLNAEEEEKSNLDWIFSHGPEIIESPHGASIEALARELGCHNLWGANGEGFTYYENSRRTLLIATPFLAANDKEGWIKFCEETRSATR